MRTVYDEGFVVVALVLAHTGAVSDIDHTLHLPRLQKYTNKFELRVN